MTALAKAGRYEITGELGRGAMGVVYKALDPVIGRTVAVKTIKLSEEGTGLSRPELLTRFQTEARAAGLLTHPNIVVVYDAGEEDGLYYITMELVEGKSLQGLLDGGQAFPLPRVLRIMEQTCSALQFAHERNVVHRDVKPANIMLTPDDTVKITDFGTAKILQFGTVQQTAHVMGTPSYMSPEQVKGKAVDGRSDIFSLGVMLYEMVTGEKPFPGQNITTVIYKIVNEDPVPPRQIDSSIHPGLSAVIMKALSKEPETRYQSCREMLEDLRDYRSLGALDGSPDATLVSGASSLPTSTVAIGAPGLRGMRSDDAVAVTARSLNARATSPSQTPAVRRTGPIAPLAEPKKKSVVGTIFAALLLIGVIVYGGYKIRPFVEDVREKNAAMQKEHEESAKTPGTDANKATENPSNANGNAASGNEGSTPSTTTKTAEPSPTPVSEKTAVKKPDATISTAAAEYKGRIEEAISEKGLSGRVRVQGTSNTLTISGKVKPSEHGELVKLLQNAPSGVQVVDHIQDDGGSTDGGPSDAESVHPVPGPGRGGIHVVTDVISATAILRGPKGHILKQCQTPCSFNDLNPSQYSLEVQKDGYQPVQTALQIRAGNVTDQKIQLESLAKGLFINTRPAGADVFINGAKQSGQTPLTLPLAPGQYDLVLRKPGFEGYSQKVAVPNNQQTKLDVELQEKILNHVAWAQVETTPKGAEILVDGVAIGQVTPARVQVSAGSHTIVMRLNGYQQVSRGVLAGEGATVNIQATMRQK